MTQIVIVGILKTGTSQWLVREALQRGLEVTIIVAPEDDLSDVFPAEAEIVYLPIDTGCIEQWIKRRQAERRCRVLVTTTHDKYIRCAAEVCARLGLPGPDPAVVSALASKSSQRQCLARAGLPTPKFMSVRIADLGRLDRLLAGFRFPVVVKPEQGSSSFGVALCQSRDEAVRHATLLRNDYEGERRHCLVDTILVEEFLSGAEYCVEFFDGTYVGAIKKEKQAGAGFIERSYSSELDLDLPALDALVSFATRAVSLAGLTWGPVHVDCIMCDGLPHVVEMNARIAGSFICEIVRDAYEFDMVGSLIRKIHDLPVTVPCIRAPMNYARVEFFLNGDPQTWQFLEQGSFGNQHLHVRYGPQEIESRERRAFVYLRSKRLTGDTLMCGTTARPADERRMVVPV